MKKLILILMITLFSAACFASEQRAIETAKAWLDIVDSGNYEESWSQAAPFFQSQLTSDQWVQAVDSVRSPLGDALSREVKNAAEHSTLPNAPDGEYVVMTLDSSFENSESVVEAVAVIKLSGKWQVVGYFIN